MRKYLRSPMTFKGLLTALCFFPLLAQAQFPHDISSIEQRPVHGLDAAGPARTAALVVDTLSDYFDRSSDFFLLNAGTGGYTLGTNSFTDAVGVHFTSLGATTKVTELAVFFTKKEIILTTDSLIARAYTTTMDSMPDQEISIGKVSVADIDTAGFATYIPLTVLDSTAGDIFVAIDYYDGNLINDTVVILSNNVLAQNGGPDGNQERRTRQLISTGDWMRVWDVWNFSGLNMDADAMILPIVEYDDIVGVEPALQARDLKLYPAYPNPAGEQVKISFSLLHPQQVQVNLFDAQGRPVWNSGAEHRPAGDQEMPLDLRTLPAGVYYYMIQAERGALAGKFTHLD